MTDLDALIGEECERAMSNATGAEGVIYGLVLHSELEALCRRIAAAVAREILAAGDHFIGDGGDSAVYHMAKRAEEIASGK